MTSIYRCSAWKPSTSGGGRGTDGGASGGTGSGGGAGAGTWTLVGEDTVVHLTAFLVVGATSVAYPMPRCRPLPGLGEDVPPARLVLGARPIGNALLGSNTLRTLVPTATHAPKEAVLIFFLHRATCCPKCLRCSFMSGTTGLKTGVLLAIAVAGTLVLMV